MMVPARKMNTLRNQIFIGSMCVMMLVLGSVGLLMYHQVSVLLRNNAESHIQQTAIQAAGRLEVLLSQIETWTSQVATDASVQRSIGQELAKKKLSFGERQHLQEEVRKLEAYATSIRSIEIYTNDYRRLLPLDDVLLNERVSKDVVSQADEAEGRLVWFGIDPRDSHSVIAVRNIRLIQQSFTKAGYLVVRVDKSYFQLDDKSNTSTENLEIMSLYDQSGKAISSGAPDMESISSKNSNQASVQINGESYISVNKRSEKTGWNLVILSPSNYMAKGISVLQTVIVFSGIGGALLFVILSFILSTLITKPILNVIKAMRGSTKFGTLQPSEAASSSTLEIIELSKTYNQMVETMNELVEVVYQKEILQSRTELKALQAQINPHFLFNTLEAFYWALDEKGEEELADLVVAMSGLFRYVITKNEEDDWVTINDELAHAERYLTIMDIRMGERLSWNINCDPLLKSTPIPKLLVQPLVENAILHGIEQQIEPGNIEIRVTSSCRSGYILISVTDTGPGMNQDEVAALHIAMKEGFSTSVKGKGIGLANVYGRLKLYYGTEQSEMHIWSTKGKGTTITLTLPNEAREGFI